MRSLGVVSKRKERIVMPDIAVDLIIVVATVAFFLLCIGFTIVYERLEAIMKFKGNKPSQGQSDEA